MAAVPLPASMTVDTYTVEVTRDGMSWVPLLGNGQSPPQTFIVSADPGDRHAGDDVSSGELRRPSVRCPLLEHTGQRK